MKLNLGSGQRRFDTSKGWVNLDLIYDRKEHKPDVAANASQLPFPDSSFSLVCTHHVLEHFGCGEADGLVREARRVLRPHGSLLVFVPDLRALAARWLTGRLDTQIYLTNLYGAYMGDEVDRHKWGFDHAYLQAVLHVTSPWQEVKAFDWRPIEGADIAKDWWILGMEAVK